MRGVEVDETEGMRLVGYLTLPRVPRVKGQPPTVLLHPTDVLDEDVCVIRVDSTYGAPTCKIQQAVSVQGRMEGPYDHLLGLVDEQHQHQLSDDACPPPAARYVFDPRRGTFERKKQSPMDIVTDTCEAIRKAGSIDTTKFDGAKHALERLESLEFDLRRRSQDDRSAMPKEEELKLVASVLDSIQRLKKQPPGPFEVEPRPPAR